MVDGVGVDQTKLNAYAGLQKKCSEYEDIDIGDATFAKDNNTLDQAELSILLQKEFGFTKDEATSIAKILKSTNNNQDLTIDQLITLLDGIANNDKSSRKNVKDGNITKEEISDFEQKDIKISDFEQQMVALIKSTLEKNKEFIPK